MNLLLLPFKFLGVLYRKIRRSMELHRYSDATIAEYFRKQGVRIGKGCNIMVKEMGTEPYLITIGDNVTIAMNVAFLTHDGAAWIFRKEDPNLQVFGPITIRDNCVIGQGVILFPNITIGPNSIVGAGSVVISDVPPNTLSMGIPARPFGSIDKYREKCLARWEQQRPPDCVIEEGANWWTSRHLPENREKLKRHLIRLYMEETPRGE